jgi:hypothetical protein
MKRNVRAPALYKVSWTSKNLVNCEVMFNPRLISFNPIHVTIVSMDMLGRILNIELTGVQGAHDGFLAA